MTHNSLHCARWFVLAASTAGLVACGGVQQVSEDDLLAMQERIEELERDAGRSQMVIEEMEERIFLLQDRVEANRIAVDRRHDVEYVRSTVNIGPGAPASAPRTRVSVAPTASAPPPYPDIDPLAGLPVVSVAPAGGTAAVAVAPAEEEVELVITNETLEQRYGPGGAGANAENMGGARSAVPRVGSRSTPQPGLVAQPPVDVGGATLPVVPVDSSGRAVQSSQATVAAAAPLAPTTSPRGLYDRALDQFNGGQYAEALQSLTSFVDSAPAPDYMDNALFWMGECYYGLGQYSDALGYFQRVVSEYPDGNKVPDSLLKVALSYERLNNVESAREVLSVVLDTYPSTDAARRAQERLQTLQ